MANTKKTWISILIAAVIVVVMLGVAVVGGAALFVHRHVHSQLVPSETAAEEFARTRARFAGQRPLIELASNDEPTVHREPARVRQPLKALHVLAYDERQGKLVHADVPAWLVQLGSGHGHLRIANLDAFDNEQLTLEDLERHGPGLVLDVHRRGGERLLVWTE